MSPNFVVVYVYMFIFSLQGSNTTSTLLHNVSALLIAVFSFFLFSFSPFFRMHWHNTRQLTASAYRPLFRIVKYTSDT